VDEKLGLSRDQLCEVIGEYDALVVRSQVQVDALLINANQNLGQYASFGHDVLPDRLGGFAGPLAGLDAGLHATAAPLLVTGPCDSPFLPRDLVARLAAARADQDADLAVARTGSQPHPVFALVHTRVRPHLARFLASGERKIDLWYSTLRVVEVAFDDEPEAFININTRGEIAQFERS